MPGDGDVESNRVRSTLVLMFLFKRDGDSAGQKILSESEKPAEPIPLCEHGEKLVYCKKCLRQIPKGISNG
jgi:hypothetical protein